MKQRQPIPTPWKWAVGEVRVANATADLEDHAVSPTVQLKLTPIALTVAGLSSEQGGKVKLSADLGLNGIHCLKPPARCSLRRSRPSSRSI